MRQPSFGARRGSVEFGSRTLTHLWGEQEARNLVAMTGGFAFFYKHAATALDMINRATQFRYILGFYPESRDVAEKFRTIEIRVNRAGTSLFYRRGYYLR